MATSRGVGSLAGSQLFHPFRALGFVTNHVPLVTQTLGSESFLITAIGSAFHVYNCSKLNLLFVGLLQEDEISCLGTYGDLVLTACGKTVTSWKRGKQVQVFEGHSGIVQVLLSFGPHVISVDQTSNVKVWVAKTAELYLEMEFDPVTFAITCMMHPSTYLNKILLCSQQGHMQLWNIKTNKLVYTFEGWSNPITAVEQAPAVDVVAVGLQSGKIVVHNLKYDETVMTFQQDWGPVTSLAFRTDGNPILATAGSAGHIALWDLEERQLQSTIRDAHRGAVCGMKFLQSQPLMVTSGPDNAVKIWIFDQSDGSARLLRSRSGHSAPPTMVRFYGSRGQAILSAGLDRTLRYLCTVRDSQSCELSQGSLTKKSKNLGIQIEQLKLPPITEFAGEENRQSQWDSIITCHQDHNEARTWHFQRKCIGQHSLKPKTEGKAGAVTAVALSSCGNFAFTGDSLGHVDVFNMQSGIHRGSFGTPEAHDGCVRGVAIDSMNQQILTAGADGKLKFWLFKSRKLLATLTHDTPIIGILLHRESSLVAVSCEDFIVYVVDMDMRRIVRKFSGHTNRVTDMTFSPDARWLMTASMDSSIRTWDLPAARLLDCFLVESPVTSLVMSPLGEFLATCHVDDLGIHLWSNKALYGQVSLVALPSDYQPSLVQMPSTSSRLEDQESDDDQLSTEEEHEQTTVSAVDEEFKSPDQLSDHLITLSMLPESRWRNLTNLDLIKKRNKPKEPPKAPKAAPFFLPTEPGLVPKFVPTGEDLPELSQSKLIHMKSLEPESDFQKVLQKSADTMQYGTVLEMFKSMGPSAIDSEIRSLAPEAGGDIQLMKNFMEFVEAQLKMKKDFELVEAYLALFLKVHGPVIAQHEELTEAARRIQNEHDEAWTQLQDLMNHCACLVSYFKSAVI